MISGCSRSAFSMRCLTTSCGHWYRRDHTIK